MKNSDNKHAEEELPRLSAVADAMVDGVTITDLHGRITYANAAVTQQLGYEREQLIGRTPAEFIADADQEKFAEQAARVLSGKPQPGSSDYQAKRKDGTEIPLAVSFSVLRDNEGKPEELIAVSRDNTERKRAEEALRTSEEKYRGIYDESVAAIYVFDAKKNFVDSNQAGLDLLGYSRDELLRMSIPDVDADPVVVLPAHEQLLSGGRLVNYEHQLKKKDGTIITVLNNSRPLTDVDGNAVGMQSTLIDITERKRAEEKLRQSERKFRIAVENNPDFIVFVKRDGTIFDVNHLARGYTKEMVIGQSIFDENWYETKDQVGAARKQIERVFRTAESGSFEYAQKAPDGSLSFYETGVAPFERDTRGGIISIQCATRDITERKRAEEKLRESEEKYRTLVETAQEGIGITDPDENLTFVNQAFADLLGYTKEELLALNLSQICDEEEFAKLRKESKKRQRGRSSRYEARLYAKTGEVKYFNVSASPLVDEKGGITATLGFLDDITERKRAEEKIKKQNEFLNNVIESLAHPFYVVNANNYIVKLANSAARTGRLSEGTTCYALTHQLGKPCKSVEHICPLEEVKKTRKSVIVEHIHYDEDGNARNVEIHGHPVFDDKGNIVQMIEYCFDITERKRAEEDLKNALHEWRVTFDSAKDLIMMLDAGFKVSRANLATARFLDRPIKEIAGKTCYQLLHGTDRPPEGCPLEKMRKTKEHEEKEFYLSEKDIWILASVDPILDDKSNVTGAVHIIRDITERKRAEEKLRESEKKFRNLVEHAHDAICIIQDDHFKFANQEFSDLLNYSWEELKQLDFKEVIAPEHRDMVADRHYRRQKGEEVPEKYEFVLLTKDGERRYVELSVSLVDYLGEVASHCFLRDVTEKKKMEAQLIQAERLTAVGTLAYGIAHEFNNILAGILGNAEFGMGSGDSKEVEECFRVIMENCDRAGSITNSLLTLARQRQVKKEVADLTDAVENVLGLVERELEKQNIRVERKFKPVPEIVCDLGELSEVFLNMITNARDAMKPDGGTLTIDLRKRNRNIEIIFADTGGGIPDEIKGRIFEPFVTTKGALGQSEIPGTGLGLFLSIGIISRYHGKIEVESQVGKGSKFTIRIPVAQNQQLPDRAEAEDEEPTVLPPNLNILLVDDEETICNVVKKFLEEKGYSVVDTTSGKEGLKLFKDKSFDLVLSDITMPDMDGVKLISKLKNMNPDIRIVTLTGHVAEEKLEAARKAGADQILLKPFRKEYLYRAIGRALSV